MLWSLPGRKICLLFYLPGKIKSAVYVVHSTGIAPYANKALSTTENPLKNGRIYRIMNRRYEQGEYYDYSSTCFGLGAAFTLANLSVLVTPGGCRNILFSSGGWESHSIRIIRKFHWICKCSGIIFSQKIQYCKIKAGECCI